MALPHGWAVAPLEFLLDYEQPQKYLVESTAYNDLYPTPVLTAGKSFIIGHTKEIDGIYSKHLPVIIFDDFTTSSQFVTFPFKVKSSAMKMLQVTIPELNIKYLYYRMQLIRHNATTHKRYWISDYSKNVVEVAPLPEQHRIVAKIDTLFSKLDKGVEVMQTVRQQLRTYRQAVLKKLYNWNIPSDIGIKCAGVVAINTLCLSISDGDHQAPPQVKHGVPFLVISNIASGRVDYKSTRFVPETYYKALDEKRVPKTGDVLYSVTGSFGIPAIVESDEPFCVQRHIAMLRPNKVTSKYLFYMLKTPQVYLKAKEIATGTAQLTVPITGLRLIQIPIPYTEKDQVRIVAEIESRLSVCDKLEQLVDENLTKAQALRQSILKKAFAGELVPQDPNDEPMEKLLERIKAMKESTVKSTTARRKRK